MKEITHTTVQRMNEFLYQPGSSQYWLGSSAVAPSADHPCPAASTLYDWWPEAGLRPARPHRRRSDIPPQGSARARAAASRTPWAGIAWRPGSWVAYRRGSLQELLVGSGSRCS